MVQHLFHYVGCLQRKTDERESLAMANKAESLLRWLKHQAIEEPVKSLLEWTPVTANGRICTVHPSI